MSQNRSSEIYLSCFEIRLLQMNLFVRRRSPDEVGAISVDIHRVPQRYRRRVLQDEYRFPKQFFPFFHIEHLLLGVQDLIEFGIAVAEDSLCHAGAKVLLKERVRVREAASSGEIKSILAVFIVGIKDAPLRGFEICFDADFRKLFDDNLRDFTVLRVSPGGTVVVDLKAVGKACLDKKLLRLLGVIRVSSRLGVVAEYLWTEQAPQWIGVSFQHELNDAVAIDGMSHSPANLGIVHRLISRTQNQKDRPQSLHRLDAKPRVRFKSLHFMRRKVADDIGLACFQRGNPRSVFLNIFVDDFIDFWRLAPVIFGPADDELSRTVPADEFKRSGSNRRTIRLTHFFRHRLFHDHPAIYILERVGVRFFESQNDGEVIGSVNLFDVFQVWRLQAL